MSFNGGTFADVVAYTARRQFAFSTRGCHKLVSTLILLDGYEELIFINFLTREYGIVKGIFCHFGEQECGKRYKDRVHRLEAIDAFSCSPSDSLPGRFAFRSFVFAGSINIYIA